MYNLSIDVANTVQTITWANVSVSQLVINITFNNIQKAVCLAGITKEVDIITTDSKENTDD